MSSNKELCPRDLSILDLLFDKTPIDLKVEDFSEPIRDKVEVTDIEENSEEIIQSKKLEKEGIELTEAAKFGDALNKFNEAIKIAPNRPSPFNNRAQLRRFLNDDEEAINDLTKAIELSGENYKLTKCRAYAQRGIIKRKLNDLDAARDDFNESAKLGSEFARQQLVELNPYTQLCNQMVNQILTKYQ